MRYKASLYKKSAGSQEENRRSKIKMEILNVF